MTAGYTGEITLETLRVLIDHPQGCFKSAVPAGEKLLVCNQCDLLPEVELLQLTETLHRRVSRPDYIVFTRMEPEPFIYAVRKVEKNK